MHSVVIDKPYEFVPPHRGKFFPKLIQRLLPWHLSKRFGMEKVKCEGLEKLQESMRAGHGVMIAPNHCRPSDPAVINEMCRQAGTPAFTMASWHLFMAGKMQRFVLNRVGGFSVYREGTDRAALKAAMEILKNAERPLVIFPEGVITRANDRLLALMDGVSFIAYGAAKKRMKKDGGKVVVHPVAVRYEFHGDAEPLLKSALSDIESKLSWRSQEDYSLIDRIYRVGNALLSLKEIEYTGQTFEGGFDERTGRLIDHLLVPSEQEWLGSQADSAPEKSTVARVKQLRVAILKEMIDGELSKQERDRRWEQMAAMYLAQQISHYPPEYVRRDPNPMRMMETVERFEEDLTGVSRIYRPMSANLVIGDAIEADPGKRGQGDVLMEQLVSDLKSMLGIDQSVSAMSLA